MKRLLILIFIVCFVFVSGFAQIEKSFYGFTIGKSKTKEVREHFQRLGSTIIDVPNGFLVKKLSYYDLDWRYVSFQFENDLLCRVEFNYEEKKFAQKYRQIRDLFNKRYGSKYEIFQAERLAIYSDKKTDCFLRLNNIDKKNRFDFYVCFVDKEFVDKQVKK